MSAQPLTEERLAELEKMHDQRTRATNGWSTMLERAVPELIADNRRLRAENERLREWANHDFEECPDCLVCAWCGGLGTLCEFHSGFDKDGCDCDASDE